jgi:hypothetical protein
MLDTPVAAESDGITYDQWKRHRRQLAMMAFQNLEWY